MSGDEEQGTGTPAHCPRHAGIKSKKIGSGAHEITIYDIPEHEKSVEAVS